MAVRGHSRAQRGALGCVLGGSPRRRVPGSRALLWSAGLLWSAVLLCSCAELPPANAVDPDELAPEATPANTGATDTRAAEPSAQQLEQALRVYAGGPYAAQRARSRAPALKHAGPAAARFETTRISEPPSVDVHVGSRRRIDVKLHQADLTEALRLIAHSGGINLVIGQGVEGQVTVELRRVTAFAALLAIAQAHGARVVHAQASRSAPILIVEPAR